ncbi:MAG: Wzz/FepE/Etk N-terminal domain-containing protein [Jatrophihabitantaceae bacterium]
MNGRPLAATFWRRRWTALTVGVLVAAAAAACLLFATRSYTATATIVAAPTQALAPSHSTVDDLQSTIAHLADSGPVLSAVRGEVGGRRSVADLQDEVWAERVGGTVLIRIHVEDTDARYARDVANAIADALPKHDPSGGQLFFASAGRATVPRDFSSPDVLEVVVVGALLAVLLGAGAALVRERSAGRVDDSRQLATLTGAPVLARVSPPADPAELPAESSTSPVAAEFRALRVALEFASQDDPASVVVLAPIEPEAVAAWTTLNLASALAQVDHRVLVIDADFGARYPHPAMRSKGPGLADVMRGTVELRHAVRPTPVSRVCLLTAGNLGTSSAADLIELRFHKALAQIDHELDLVLVHAPPLRESDDARVMAVGNALLLTVAPGRVRAAAMRDIAAELQRLRLRLVGSVLLDRRGKRRR